MGNNPNSNLEKMLTLLKKKTHKQASQSKKRGHSAHGLCVCRGSGLVMDSEVSGPSPESALTTSATLGKALGLSEPR